ncbi:hypothetical protein F4679DRAFT_198569 [Xylaria curta]|nr:hypothetical protein F4679DRAFT_198569 [Xylaria curta]
MIGTTLVYLLPPPKKHGVGERPCYVICLLNLPLIRNSHPSRPDVLRGLIRICVGLQWSLIIITSALQGWDAVVVTAWTALCAIFVTYIYSPECAAADWLRYSCGLEIFQIRTTFTGRRSMLASLVYINPDQKMTGWIDPILAKGDARMHWEAALFQYIESGKVDEQHETEYWKGFVTEGVEMGKRLMGALRRAEQGSAFEYQ